MKGSADNRKAEEAKIRTFLQNYRSVYNKITKNGLVRLTDEDKSRLEILRHNLGQYLAYDGQGTEADELRAKAKEVAIAVHGKNYYNLSEFAVPKFDSWTPPSLRSTPPPNEQPVYTSKEEKPETNKKQSEDIKLVLNAKSKKALNNMIGEIHILIQMIAINKSLTAQNPTLKARLVEAKISLNTLSAQLEEKGYVTGSQINTLSEQLNVASKTLQEAKFLTKTEKMLKKQGVNLSTIESDMRSKKSTQMQQEKLIMGDVKYFTKGRMKLIDADANILNKETRHRNFWDKFTHAVKKFVQTANIKLKDQVNKVVNPQQIPPVPSEKTFKAMGLDKEGKKFRSFDEFKAARDKEEQQGKRPTPHAQLQGALGDEAMAARQKLKKPKDIMATSHTDEQPPRPPSQVLKPVASKPKEKRKSVSHYLDELDELVRENQSKDEPEHTVRLEDMDLGLGEEATAKLREMDAKKKEVFTSPVREKAKPTEEKGKKLQELEERKKQLQAQIDEKEKRIRELQAKKEAKHKETAMRHDLTFTAKTSRSSTEVSKEPSASTKLLSDMDQEVEKAKSKPTGKGRPSSN